MKYLIIVGKSIFFYIPVSVGILFLSNACSTDKPEADFNAVNATVVGDSVVFSNNSSNASYYQWNFGDNTFAITTNAKHAYTKAGIYTVTLNAIGKDKSNSESKTITVTGTISIYEGIGVTEASLSDIWHTLQNKFSGEESIMNTDTSGQYYHHSVFYSNRGIVIDFYNFLPAVIDSSELPDIIALINDYKGYTVKGITLGNDISLAEKVYGTPGTQLGQDNCYYYDDLGIQFWTTPPSAKINEIDVYPPYTSKSSLVSGEKLNGFHSRKSGGRKPY